MFKLTSVLVLVSLAADVYGDRACLSRSGRCQSDRIYCLGGYRSRLCNGAANRRCCLPASGDCRCSAAKGFCQADYRYCPGGYRSGMCGGPRNRRCCLPIVPVTRGRSVDYRGYTISDSNVKQKLWKIANLFGSRVWVTSGNRNGNGRSHHDHGRAADFWIDGGLSGRVMFDRIRRSGILARDYQVIWHGPNTCTGGQHLHIGRYADNRLTCWVHEGTTSNNRCVYRCM